MVLRNLPPTIDMPATPVGGGGQSHHGGFEGEGCLDVCEGCEEGGADAWIGRYGSGGEGDTSRVGGKHDKIDLVQPPTTGKLYQRVSLLFCAIA